MSDALAVLAGAALTLMMLLGCANMVLRAVWIPIKGSYELMGFLGALATAFGLAYTHRYKGHIALTIFSGKLSPRLERWVDACTSLAAAVFFFFIAWRTTAWAGRLMASGELSDDLHIAFYPIVVAMAFGVFALSILLVNDVLRILFNHDSSESRS